MAQIRINVSDEEHRRIKTACVKRGMYMTDAGRTLLLWLANDAACISAYKILGEAGYAYNGSIEYDLMDLLKAANQPDHKQGEG